MEMDFCHCYVVMGCHWVVALRKSIGLHWHLFNISYLEITERPGTGARDGRIL